MERTLIADTFTSLFSAQPILVRSPGRVNLIGEHTDYNDGFVLPAAINKEIVFAVAPNDLSRCRLHAYDLKESEEFDPNAFSKSKKGWANYLLGVVDQLKQQGFTLGGFDVVFGGNIPQGAGMSSSAALECGIATALNHLFDLGLDQTSIAKLSQKAENEYVGVKCGIMDQFANVFGKRNHVIRLDCRSLAYEYFPFEIEGYKIVLFDTNVSHSLASSEYNVRRQQCEEGVRLLQQHGLEIKNLRDVTLDMLVQYKSVFDEVIFRRCWYVVEENKRVEEACYFLEQGDLEAFGKKMYESHEGLSCQYEVSCPELDFLVEQTRHHEQVVGARMMGGGFGGCTINLVQEAAVEPLAAHLQQLYQQQFDRPLKVYVGDIVHGTELIRQA